MCGISRIQASGKTPRNRDMPRVIAKVSFCDMGLWPLAYDPCRQSIVQRCTA
jgi:hypothetical protein